MKSGWPALIIGGILVAVLGGTAWFAMTFRADVEEEPEAAVLSDPLDRRPPGRESLDRRSVLRQALHRLAAHAVASKQSVGR